MFKTYILTSRWLRIWASRTQYPLSTYVPFTFQVWSEVMAHVHTYIRTYVHMFISGGLTRASDKQGKTLKWQRTLRVRRRYEMKKKMAAQYFFFAVPRFVLRDFGATLFGRHPNYRLPKCPFSNYRHQNVEGITNLPILPYPTLTFHTLTYPTLTYPA
jgi:hypothetical protein